MDKECCSECKKELVYSVCHSNAGYYVGITCDCGAYSRNSQYFKKRKEAEDFLKDINKLEK